MMERTRAEHLTWCKRRALEYLDAGDLKGAAASMASDYGKHPEMLVIPGLMLIGIFEAAHGNKEAVRRWIESFN